MASSTDNTFPTSASAADPSVHLPLGSTATTQRSSAVLDRVVQGAHQTIDRLAETVAPHVQKLEGGVTSASDSLHVKAGHARDVSDEWAESLRVTVRDNPIAAVAAALAVGMLISRITR